MDCMIKGCSGDGFDLTSVVAGMVKSEKKEGKGTITCNGKIDLLEPGHASIEYQAAIRYKKSPKSNS